MSAIAWLSLGSGLLSLTFVWLACRSLRRMRASNKAAMEAAARLGEEQGRAAALGLQRAIERGRLSVSDR